MCSALGVQGRRRTLPFKMPFLPPPFPVKLGLQQVPKGLQDVAVLFAMKTNRAMPAFIRSVTRAMDDVLKCTAASSASRDLLMKSKPRSRLCESYFKSLKEKGVGCLAGWAGGKVATALTLSSGDKQR